MFSIFIWGSITLSEQYFANLDFKIRVVNEPSGYVCGYVDPQTINIKLKAKGWQLLSLNLGVRNTFLISADNDSGFKKLDVFGEINENSWISPGMTITEIFPREILFNVEKIKFKKLKIVADTDLDFSSEYGLATPIQIIPDSVLVGGPASIIDKINEIKTKPISLSSLDSKIKIISELEELRGFRSQKSKVEVIFDVQRIVEKTFENINITITDVPKDRDVVLLPNNVSCTLRGGISVLGKISKEQIKASIKYKDVILDTIGTLKPEIEIPQYTTLTYSKPVRVGYIIKKYE